MSLANGIYTLRACPAAGVGGMYATGQNEVNAPVTLAAQAPGLFSRQNWKIAVVNAEESTYTIILDTSGAVFGGVFSTLGPSVIPEGQIVTSERMQEWYIVPFDSGIPGTYTISPITEVVGMQWYVGTEGEEVVVNAYNLLGPAGPIPYWQILNKAS